MGYIDYFFNIARTHDGGFACTGMRIGTIPYNTDGWVIKFDSLGCLSANCWLGINETTLHKPDLPFVFPNPTTDFCIVRFTHQGPVQVEVFDAIGRQIKNVRALPFGDTDIHIDLRQTPSGILLLRLKNGSNILSTKIIKK
ncbi:MAG: T9SS type A sorting domain-containing protein [Bacteroidetes bacterium]|nr:T9SS type A sorting domain-containing protein [Bacteroidota bacterium]